MERSPDILSKKVRSSRAGVFISKLLAEFRAPKRPIYHLYGESAQRARLPIDREAANQLADEVLKQYFSERTAEEA